MHVRIPSDHIPLAKRLASRAGLSLADYIDQLVMADVRTHAGAVREELTAWKLEAQDQLRAAEVALAELSDD
jgi:hypothetical protein